MWSWLLVSIAAANCPDDPVGAVRENAAAMEVTFSELEEERFDEAHAALDDALPCVATPLALRDILLLHRANAIASFMDGDMVASKKSWGAVRVLNPEWQPPRALVPEGHLIRTLFEQAPIGPEEVELDMRPENGWLVDGRESMAVPEERAFVLQGLTAEGVAYTGYMRTVAEIPVLDFVEPVSRVTPEMWALRRKGSLVAGGLVLGSAAAVAVWSLSLDGLKDPLAIDDDQARRRMTTAQVAGVSAWVLGVGAVGVFTVSWSVKL